MIHASLIVDGANWAYAANRVKVRVNFERLIVALERHANVQIIGMTLWGAFKSQADVGARWSFYSYLKGLGWQVNLIPATLIETDTWADKGVDINIALDAYEDALGGQVGAVMIGSGDGDFSAVFKRFPAGVAGYAVGFRGKMASSLSEAAKIIHLDDLGVLYSDSRGMGWGP